MPIWSIYHPEGTFTTLSEKQSLARSITWVYTSAQSHLPAFYVNVNFIPVAAESMFVSGELRPFDASRNPNPNAKGSKKPFIRFVVDHIAVKVDDRDEAYQRVCDKIDKAVTEHMVGKGYDWEYHVTETERRLWRINGLAPPPWKSEGEKVWREENVPVPLE